MRAELVPQEVLSARQAMPSMPATQPWNAVNAVSTRSHKSTYTGSVESRVETRWDRPSPTVVRRGDDWYDVGGGRPLEEERALTWRGLIGLRWTARVPAPVYHDIMGDEGWLGGATHVLTIRADAGFPHTPGHKLEARAQRRMDSISGGKPRADAEHERTIVCMAADAAGIQVIHPAIPGPIVPVACESTVRNASQTAAQPAGRTRYAYSVPLGLFIVTEVNEREPKHPYDADDAPARWSSTTIRYSAFSVDR